MNNGFLAQLKHFNYFSINILNLYFCTTIGIFICNIFYINTQYNFFTKEKHIYMRPIVLLEIYFSILMRYQKRINNSLQTRIV